MTALHPGSVLTSLLCAQGSVAELDHEPLSAADRDGTSEFGFVLQDIESSATTEPLPREVSAWVAPVRVSVEQSMQAPSVQLFEGQPERHSFVNDSTMHTQLAPLAGRLPGSVESRRTEESVQGSQFEEALPTREIKVDEVLPRLEINIAEALPRRVLSPNPGRAFESPTSPTPARGRESVGPEITAASAAGAQPTVEIGAVEALPRREINIAEALPRLEINIAEALPRRVLSPNPGRAFESPTSPTPARGRESVGPEITATPAGHRRPDPAPASLPVLRNIATAPVSLPKAMTLASGSGVNVMTQDARPGAAEGRASRLGGGRQPAVFETMRYEALRYEALRYESPRRSVSGPTESKEVIASQLTPVLAPLTAPSATPAHASGLSPNVQINLNADDWQEHLTDFIKNIVASEVAGEERMTVIRLSPEHLGDLEIGVTLKQGEVEVALAASVAETRAALEHSLPRLRELVSQGGLELVNAGVFSSLSGDSAQRQARSTETLAQSVSRTEGGEANDPEQTPGAGVTRDSAAGIDLYV